LAKTRSTSNQEVPAEDKLKGTHLSMERKGKRRLLKPKNQGIPQRKNDKRGSCKKNKKGESGTKEKKTENHTQNAKKKRGNFTIPLEKGMRKEKSSSSLGQKGRKGNFGHQQNTDQEICRDGTGKPGP